MHQRSVFRAALLKGGSGACSPNSGTVLAVPSLGTYCVVDCYLCCSTFCSPTIVLTEQTSSPKSNYLTMVWTDWEALYPCCSTLAIVSGVFMNAFAKYTSTADLHNIAASRPGMICPPYGPANTTKNTTHTTTRNADENPIRAIPVRQGYCPAKQQPYESPGLWASSTVVFLQRAAPGMIQAAISIVRKVP